MNDQAWQPPPPPPPPPYSPPPPRSTPPPYSAPPPRAGGPRPKFRRSRTNRTIGGVAGGLGQYLGVDATVLRVGFIIASLLFLGGFGGPILYIIAWIIVPEEGKDAPITRAAFSGRPWHDWDRSARSWALVLGALALALIWSFGVWPWWHWRVLPFWLVGAAVVLWLLARHRDGNWVSSPPAAPPAWGGQAGPGPECRARAGASFWGAPGAPAPGEGPAAYGPYTPSSRGTSNGRSGVRSDDDRPVRCRSGPRGRPE